MRFTEGKRVFRGIGVLACLLAGCNATSRPDAGAPHFVVADVIVSVTNQSPGEKQLYVGSGAKEFSLGPVPKRSSRSFSLPSDLGQANAALYFEARAGREAAGTRSDTFSVSPGQQVLWTIGEHGSGPVTKR